MSLWEEFNPRENSKTVPEHDHLAVDHDNLSAILHQLISVSVELRENNPVKAFEGVQSVHHWLLEMKRKSQPIRRQE